MSGAPAAILAMPPGPPSAGAPASPSTAAPDPTGNGDAGAVRTFDDVLSQQTQVVGSPQHDHEHDGDQRGAKEGGSHGKHPASGAGTSMSGDAAAVDAAVLPIDGPSPFAVATPPAKGEASLTAAGDEDGLTVEAAGQASHDGSAPVTEQPNGVPNERVVAPGPAPVTTSGELTQADGTLEAGAEAGANVSPEPPPVPMHPAGTSQASGHVPGENARAPFRPDTAAVAAVSSALPTPPSTTGPSATPLPTSHPGQRGGSRRAHAAPWRTSCAHRSSAGRRLHARRGRPCVGSARRGRLVRVDLAPAQRWRRHLHRRRGDAPLGSGPHESGDVVGRQRPSGVDHPAESGGPRRLDQSVGDPPEPTGGERVERQCHLARSGVFVGGRRSTSARGVGWSDHHRHRCRAAADRARSGCGSDPSGALREGNRP